jgi:hypothetical protein
MTTRMHPPDAMMDFLRQPGTATTRVVGMVESISGWCSNKITPLRAEGTG